MHPADLGPIPPRRANDPPAFRIRRYAIIADLTALNQAILTFTGKAAGNDREVTLLLTADPRTGDIQHCTVVYSAVALPGMKQSETIDVAWIPGNVADIARTKVLEVFGPKAPA